MAEEKRSTPHRSTGSKAAGAAKRTGKRSGNVLTQKFGPLPLWGWIAAGVVLLYLYQRSKGGGSSASTQAATGSSSMTGEPTVTYSSPSGLQYSGPPGELNNILGSGGATSPGQGTTGTSPGSGAGTPGTNQGFGQIKVGGTEYDILGIESGVGPQAYSGYNVSGGAPVYYYQQGKTPQQGAGEAVQGAYVLVPSIYGKQISSSANHPYRG